MVDVDPVLDGPLTPYLAPYLQAAETDRWEYLQILRPRSRPGPADSQGLGKMPLRYAGNKKELSQTVKLRGMEILKGLKALTSIP